MKRKSLIIILTGLVAFMGNQCVSNQKDSIMQTVTSNDGTVIAYEKSGNGPAVILVTGALAVRTDYAKLAKELSPEFTVYTYDRRGRGDSGDTKPYAVKREIEDINALIDEAGGSAFLFGTSSGACLVLEAAAALGNKVGKLAIYEPPYDEAEGAAERWETYSQKLHELLGADQRADAVEFHMKFVGVPDAALLAMKASPGWPHMKELAPTIAYDVAVVGETRSIPVNRVAAIKAPALVMDGGASLTAMPFMRASADKLGKTVPNVQRLTLEGEAHNVSEKALAPVLKAFFKNKNQPKPEAQKSRVM
jgi:pimeloyl-ACP methyl ester carboxylesterase